MIRNLRLKPFYQTSGGSSGIRRTRANKEVSNPSAEEKSAPIATVQTYEVLQDTRLNVDSPDSIQQLREMAQRGEFPEFIESITREGRERFYEEFDRLYPDPPGILNDYRVEPNGKRMVRITYNYSLAEAESPQLLTIPSNASESAKRGAIKYAIYKTRPRVEYALYTRLGGFSDIQLAREYGGRVVSTAERDLINSIMEMQVSSLLDSPLTREGRRGMNSDWVPRDGGWFRIGTDRFAEQRAERERRS